MLKTTKVDFLIIDLVFDYINSIIDGIGGNNEAVEVKVGVKRSKSKNKTW